MTTVTPLQAAGVFDAIERVRPVIERNRDVGEADRRLPDEVVDALTDAGLLRLWAPREAGGLEVDIRTCMLAIEAISRIDASTGWIYGNMVAGQMQAAFIPEEARTEILGDSGGVPMAGSVASVGRAVREGDGYRISGQWRLASGCHHADWFGGAVLVFDGDAPMMNPDGTPDLKIAFFPRSDAEILDTWNPLGMRGTGSDDFRVMDTFVPERRVFSVLTAPPLLDGALYKAGVLVLFSLALSSVLPGMAQHAIDSFIELARDKVPTMSTSNLGSRPTVHVEVARAQTLVHTARAYLLEVADELMASLEAGNGVTEELEIKRRLACVNVGVSCRQAVDIVHALAGTSSINAGHPLERCLRDIHTASQHFLVSPAWLEKTGQYYFGHGLGMP